ncbi:hypothetical protein ACIBO2_41440 [Nonomuraea sp. NPDC050022]|uniref:hypothetical protein n=1 Tax=unclassified Nonomuraea TaxID=2593643 RepID=UPI0033D1DC85
MKHLSQTLTGLRLDAALKGVATTFRGMTARPDEHNCECHWGSAEDLARLKVPDVWLSLDLLGRTLRATDWDDHGSVLRRILPQLASDLVDGYVENLSGMEEVGRSFVRGQWRDWPAEQVSAIWAFLHAWWTYSLTTSEIAVPAHEVLVLCTEASGTLDPWLAAWEAVAHPVADQRLAEAVAHWESDLPADRLPWDAWDEEEDKRAKLSAWLARHAPARLRAYGAPSNWFTVYDC